MRRVSSTNLGEEEKENAQKKVDQIKNDAKTAANVREGKAEAAGRETIEHTKQET